MQAEELFDVVIVGGGPAGLSAALVLGRACRRVLVYDAGNPRNARSRAVHGFLTRDGVFPGDLLAVAREQLRPYAVEIRDATVMSICPENGCFRITISDGSGVLSRKVLLATGVVDRLPPLEGIQDLYGKSVHHCPYCDGWEHRDKPLAVYGRASAGAALALSMKTWSRDVVLCSDGPARLRDAERKLLSDNKILLHEQRIKRLEGSGGLLENIVFEDGKTLSRSALFFGTGNLQRSELPVDLGCSLTPKGAVRTGKHQESNVRGVYVAGDACFDAQYVIVAAAEGAKAAMAINAALQEDDGNSIHRLRL
ncbi:MAG TPA: NAD(P)/FAD-dependent oxidoreductase [Bryobacteraceae bacterium]|nr:NAD(P)/FAD-dependent oxidoreductase [Bryobacteraceae bacterium]